jgi:hypothetical protein
VLGTSELRRPAAAYDASAYASNFSTSVRNFYGLINLIEICRQKNNPPLPQWLELEYRTALQAVLNFAIEDISQVQDALTLRQLLASIAVAKGELKLGEFLSFRDDSEIDAFLAGEFEWT